MFLLMMLHPAARKKAQEEIDRVVGSDRLPTYADREHMPYVEACIAEVMRVHTLGPFGGLRAAAQDDVYEGYVTPKGALVVPNMW